MTDAETIYDDMWSKAFPLFLKDQVEADPLIMDPGVGRRGLTLRARPGKELALNIAAFTRQLQPIIPDQYYIPASDLHLTILAIVSCSVGISREAIHDQAYIKTISECIGGLPLPRITFSGITASPSCLMLRGYPENDSLTELRDRLRDTFRKSPLPSSIDARYAIRTAHITVMRFQTPQKSLAGFTHFITEHKEHEFGRLEIGELELVSNDWYHKKENTRLLHTFTMGA